MLLGDYYKHLLYIKDIILRKTINMNKKSFNPDFKSKLL